MLYTEGSEEYLKQSVDWEIIEEYVMSYQSQFAEGATEETVKKAKLSAELLIEKFSPLIKKYIGLLKSGDIDWDDPEMKSFISSFMDDRSLIRALNRKKQTASFRSDIYYKFDFILKTYGKISEEEMTTDLNSLLLLKANKYKQQGKNFCSYVYNVYKYEVSRHIKKFTSNPLNVSYKNSIYDDAILSSVNMHHEDEYHNSETGIPDMSWISGVSCSNLFLSLSAIDRKILIKYYMEEYNDSQIADVLGMHINTVNQRRRSALKTLADDLGLDYSDIKRTRKSGNKN